MPEFYPAQLNPLLVRLCQSVSPIVGYLGYHMQLDIQPTCLDRLADLKEHRMLLLPNHPTFHDWIATLLLSARLGELFHYLAAYERFRGWGGRFLQQMGAYSIRRGLGDRPSVAYTIELLMQPQCRLVIFPEGGCSFQNDTVMPFRSGAIQVALQAISRLVKQGQPIPDLYAIPLSIKYRYTSDMTAVLHSTLTRLEKALELPQPSSPQWHTFYKRLEQIADQVLLNFEREYGLTNGASPSLSRNDRILCIKAHLLQTCEQTLGIVPTATDLVRERVYRIQYLLEARAESFTEDFQTYNTMHKAAASLLNFDAIYDGYVAENPTSERFLDTLTRLERAVFRIDQPPPKGFRKVLMRVGKPLNLKDYFEAYQRDRAGTVEWLVQHLQQTVQANLDHLNQQRNE